MIDRIGSDRFHSRQSSQGGGSGLSHPITLVDMAAATIAVPPPSPLPPSKVMAPSASSSSSAAASLSQWVEDDEDDPGALAVTPIRGIVADASAVKESWDEDFLLDVDPQQLHASSTSSSSGSPHGSHPESPSRSAQTSPARSTSPSSTAAARAGIPTSSVPPPANPRSSSPAGDPTQRALHRSAICPLSAVSFPLTLTQTH